MAEQTPASRLHRGAVAAIRDAAWLTPARITAYARLLLLAMLLVSLQKVVSGAHIAMDFRSFWAASKLALEGRADAVYQPLQHYAVERAIPGTASVSWAAFLYPPVFLLFCLPLALLPFALSAVAWTVVTGAAFAASLRPWLPRSWTGWTIAAAFPAAWSNLGFGQNGFLTAALLGFGGRWLERRPVLAGICFGCLAIKPQLGVAIPVALVAAGRWRCFAAAAATVLALGGLSLLAFGGTPWLGFLHNLPLAGKAIELGDETPLKMATAAGAALLLGASLPVADAVQAVVALAACAVLALLAWRRPGAGPEAAAICVCAALTSPWLHYYDLTVLALPIAWLAAAGRHDGFLPYEKFSLLCAYLLPVIGIPLAYGPHLPAAALTVAALLALIARRAWRVTPRMTDAAPYRRTPADAAG